MPILSRALRDGRVPILVKTLRDQRVQILSYGLGLALYAALMVLISPSFRDALGDFELPSGYEAIVGEDLDFSSPTGFFGTELFPWIPLIVAIFAVAAGTAATAGEESSGTIESLLALPFSRRSVLLQKAAAIAISSVLILTLMAVGFAVSVPFVDLEGELTLIELASASFASLPFVWLVAAASMFLGAVAPSRGVATGVAATLVIVWWLMATFAGLASSLDWLRTLSPYHYSGAQGILSDGVIWWHALVNLGLMSLCVLLALRAFEGREIGSARWQFRALRLKSGIARPVPDFWAS